MYNQEMCTSIISLNLIFYTDCNIPHIPILGKYYKDTLNEVSSED